jgi:regulator of replication initiation timing
MRKKTIVSLLSALTLVMPLIGCEDTKARQGNEQLQAQIAGLVKESADLNHRVDQLTKENTALKQEHEQFKRKAKTKKTNRKRNDVKTGQVPRNRW